MKILSAVKGRNSICFGVLVTNYKAKQKPLEEHEQNTNPENMTFRVSENLSCEAHGEAFRCTKIPLRQAVKICLFSSFSSASSCFRDGDDEEVSHFSTVLRPKNIVREK